MHNLKKNIFNNERLLLTGATGFVGKQILKYLSKLDVEIVLIVRKKSEEEASVLKNIKM